MAIHQGKSAISWDLSKEPSEMRMALAHPYCRQWLLKMSVTPWQSSSVWSWRNPSRWGGWRPFKRHQSVGRSPSLKHRSILQLPFWIWDDALDRGPVGATRALAELKLLSAPVCGDRRCILPRYHLPVENTDLMIDHFLRTLPLTQTHSSRKFAQHLTPFLTWGSLFYRPYSEPPL